MSIHSGTRVSGTAGPGKATMRRPVFRAIFVLGLMAATGCYGHFDVGATRASYGTSGNDPTYRECMDKVIGAQESFNAYGRWWQRSVVTGIVLGVAIGVTAIVTARDAPGDHAATTADAIDSERKISGLELTTAALATMAAADAVLAWYSTAGMSEQATEVAGHLSRCPPRPTPASSQAALPTRSQ